MSGVGFVLCTRTDSSRLPGKVFRKINGVPLIERLIKNLQKTNLPIHIAYPESQHDSYRYLGGLNNVYLFASKDHHDDPLRRMRNCANFNMLDTVIRVSHDKVFVEPDDIKAALQVYKEKKLDYLYSTYAIAGTGFEIISTDSLNKAADKFKNVEYIGYAIRSVTPNFFNWNPKHPPGNFRFLVDYEQDLKLLDVLFSQIPDVDLKKACKYLDKNPEIKITNSNPLVTVYTCAYNGEAWLQDAMESVEKLSGFKDFEYILIDDHSTDRTCEIMAKFASKHSNVTWFRNEQNLGLSSSSNLALKKAKGKYIIRLDADDYFVKPHAVKEMIKQMQEQDLEAIYPDNYFGDFNKVQKGNEIHHAAGTLFDKAALTHVKFTDGLMGHDSLDLYLRARHQLKIGYFEKPVFFYRQHNGSLSKTNLEKRQRLKDHLLKNPGFVYGWDEELPERLDSIGDLKHYES
jgi:spore coat polysaccharide biosynthesis protein SpsF (cytidylyltransferase family)